MFDIKWIRDNPQAFDAGLARRGLEALSAQVIELDEARRGHIQKLQDAQSRRNAASREIGQAMGKGDTETADRLKAEVGELKSFLASATDVERELDGKLNDLLAGIANIPLDEAPDGASEDDNVEIRQIGERPSFSFAPKQHFELGEALGLMDFEVAARLSGARFVVLRGALARLERALAQFMLDLQTGEHGYTETYVPAMVNTEVLYGVGQLPKFADDLFKTEDGRWLIPTSEAPLTNLVREQVVAEADLPMRVTAYTQCFRAEAGAAGRDTRGMIRQHQFSKVELVSITTPEQSRAELDRMTACAEEVLKRLGLHYRVMALSTGDMGFGSQLTFDLEVWLPGQDMFREISSCSVCGDFQARRLNGRFKPVDGGKPQFVHTLNGSGLAVGRTLVAILENYQQADGSIRLPDVLKPYMGGLDVIAADG